MPRSTRFVRPLALLALALVATLALAGCGDSGELPRRMPDVVGETVDDAVEELRGDGFEEVLIFGTEVHAVDPWDGAVDGDSEVAMTFPEADDDSEPTVHLWVGALPEVPANVPAEAWYYPHGARIEDRGTDLCLTCHERDSCGVCHEERLEETAALLRSDPAEAPDLSKAVASALGVDEDDVLALNRGDGWFRVDVAASASDGRAATAAAREAAAVAFPAAFGQQADAETLVIAWVDGEDPLVEIGFERATFEAEDWTAVEGSDIPWIADRYAVPSD